jgi:hypothetical protein
LNPTNDKPRNRMVLPHTSIPRSALYSTSIGNPRDRIVSAVFRNLIDLSCFLLSFRLRVYSDHNHYCSLHHLLPSTRESIRNQGNDTKFAYPFFGYRTRNGSHIRNGNRNPLPRNTDIPKPGKRCWLRHGIFYISDKYPTKSAIQLIYPQANF